MTERQDRRMPGVNRVPVARLVDICGRDATVPAFEAESVEVSGRGMHVRTPYLPPLGAPLVCRLEDDGREIVVEGVVAWQSEDEAGGEFGVQFTALDSGSVEALKSLCGLLPRAGEARQEAPKGARAEPREAEEAAAQAAPPGAPVKLHIDGLGAPMKARVKGGSTRKLQVGSNLEFLKVGKNLQIEDVEQGDKRGARIDAVSIALDPETQVPQLVVVLRYEGEDRTPEPSVVGAEAGHVGAPARSARVAYAGHAASSPSDDDGDSSVEGARAQSVDASDAGAAPAEDGRDERDESDQDAEVSAAAMRGPVDQLAAQMGKRALETSQKLAAASGVAAKGLAAFMKAGGAKLFAARTAAPPKRRSTAPAPPSTLPREPRLRPQNGPARAEAEAEASTPPRNKKAAVVIGAASLVVLTAVGLGVSARGRSDAKATARAGDPSAESAQPGALPPLQPLQTPAGVAPGNGAQAAPSYAALSAATPNVGLTAPGAVAAPGMPVNGAPGATGARGGVVANVPLFGPTSMATVEPAPLGPSPDEITAMATTAAPRNLVPGGDEARLDDEDPRSAARDESFDDGESKKKDGKGSAAEAERSPEAIAESVKPFGLGKMHLPVVYRLKLDKPGAALEGKSQGSGFTVTVPGRKVDGSSSAITKRDDRISEVKLKNGPTGAAVTFVFRSKVPGYKVRLRKSYLEVFVSSPDSAR